MDKWLWSVRLYASRTAATVACTGGHVRVDGAPAKPATVVRVGSRIAFECYLDHSPPAPPREEYVLPLFVRARGTGRPTKRDRRQLDRFRAR